MDQHTNASTDPAPAPLPTFTGADIALLLIGLVPLGPLSAGTWHIWRRSTTSRELQEALDWLEKAPRNIEDAIKFRSENGDFDLSTEALECLGTFKKDHGM